MHRAVDKVDEVALQDAACPASALRRFVAGEQVLCGWFPPFLHDRGDVEDAVQSSVTASVQSVSLFVG
ncbi:MAG: hypothetical protein WBP09_13175 [Propionicimonas sp.]